MLRVVRINGVDATDPACGADAAAHKDRVLNAVEASFAGQIATAVWIGNLTDKAAREALLSYAIASGLCKRINVVRLRDALLLEYRHWRERQDLSS